MIIGLYNKIMAVPGKDVRRYIPHNIYLTFLSIVATEEPLTIDVNNFGES